MIVDTNESRPFPQVLIICGPFLDCNNDKVSSGEVHLQHREEPCSFEEVYAELFALLFQHLQPLRRASPPTE
eukprot:symbB.v1.2.024593.t1/scaffold2341.1/size81865/1